jgi:PTH1 family peptidyl-tRNA hydrolase
VNLLRRRLGGADQTSSVAWLVVGLGNPGPRYAGTRHNIGRDAVDALASRHGIRLGSTKFNARFGHGDVAGAPLCLAEPLTYMNLSGQAVAPLARFFKVPAERVLLVFDDMDLPLGALRLRPDGGSGGHNGVASVIASLGTPTEPRVRLGIGRPAAGWDAADYVLARFDATERAAAEELVGRAADAVEAIIADGLDAAMNQFNRN